MKRIGLTGCMGSGKSTIARLLESRGIPVYYADDRAKQLSTAPEVQEELRAQFSLPLEADGCVSRLALARIVFADPAALLWLNNLLHPLVLQDFNQWCQRHQHQALVVMEAALIFEVGWESLFDAVWVVDAPEKLCIERICRRDSTTPEAAHQRLSRQLSASEKRLRTPWILCNDGEKNLDQQIDRILLSFL